MTTGFVLSGGGSLGAVRVGMLAALDERDIRPDLLVGTSVGAINAAFIATHGFDTLAIDELTTMWKGIRRSDVFPLDALRQALALTGQRLCVEVGQVSDQAEIVVLPPLCPLSVSPVDFGHTNDLIARGHHSAAEWLDAQRYKTEHPERILSLHSHQFDSGVPRSIANLPTKTRQP